MNNSVEISNIKIKIGEREIELNLEDAKKLHNVLDELFKTWQPYERRPLWIFPQYQYIIPPTNNDWTITCSSDTLNIVC